MADMLDYKKEYKQFYLPKTTPEIITIPSMQFAAVRGQGDPNAENGEYAHAMELLYGISYTIKMSYKGDYAIAGYFPYVVPPLEGLWWMDGTCGFDYTKKDLFRWVSLIRLPEFVQESDFRWAAETASVKKKADFSAVELFRYDEGLCVQCMHVGPYDDEPATIARMDAFAAQSGYALDISTTRYHHELYLSDPRKCEPSKLKTVLRHPIRNQ